LDSASNLGPVPYQFSAAQLSAPQLSAKVNSAPNKKSIINSAPHQLSAIFFTLTVHLLDHY
jgi:hypothetical protein